MEPRRCYGCMNVTNQPVCEYCGHPVSGDNAPYQLPVGTMLRGRYLVGRVRNQDTLEILYLAWDCFREAVVIVREFFPGDMALRDRSWGNFVYCSQEELWPRFLEERERFSQLIPGARDCFEENNTVYMVMEAAAQQQPAPQEPAAQENPVPIIASETQSEPFEPETIPDPSELERPQEYSDPQMLPDIMEADVPQMAVPGPETLPEPAAKSSPEPLPPRKSGPRKPSGVLWIILAAAVVILGLALLLAFLVGNKQGKPDGSEAADSSDVLKTVSSVDMIYYFVDEVQQFSQNYGSNLAYLLDPTQPLNEQVFDFDTGRTWAEHFLASAQESASAAYALSNAAEAAGYALSEEEQEQLEAELSTLNVYAEIYGCADADGYLKLLYGEKASVSSYREYLRRKALAQSYYEAYEASLNYNDAQLREAEQENYAAYSSFTYVSCCLVPGMFPDAESDPDEALCQAEAAAMALVEMDISTQEELDRAIESLNVSWTETCPRSVLSSDVLGGQAESSVAEWLYGNPQEGQLACVPRKAADGLTVDGYYVVLFLSREDNSMPLANVRHILVACQGGTVDEYGTIAYTDAEIQAAMKEAQDLLAQWSSGAATEESFGDLAALHSDDFGSADGRGLYENVYPGQMIAPFEEWCFNDRQPGDTGIIRTDYGFHIMYYCGDSSLTWRDLLIENSLREADMEQWYTGLINTSGVRPGSTDDVPLDLIIGG